MSTGTAPGHSWYSLASVVSRIDLIIIIVTVGTCSDLSHTWFMVKVTFVRLLKIINTSFYSTADPMVNSPLYNSVWFRA